MNRKHRWQGREPSTASFFSKLDLTRDLPESSVETLSLASELRQFPAGHAFFQPGESGDKLYLLEKGRVQTFRGKGRKKLFIADLQPPAVFGEMGCVGRCIYHCSAQTIAPSQVRLVSREAVVSLLLQDPVFTRRLLDLVSERFLQVLLDLESTSFRHLIPRLARFLLEQAGADDFVRALTHRQIAERLRVYRESATSALGELKNAGIIAVKRREIRILDRSRLERASRE